MRLNHADACNCGSLSLRCSAYLNHKVFIQLPVNGHLAFFFFFAVINNDAISILCMHSTWHLYASCIFLKVDNLGVRKCQCRRLKRAGSIPGSRQSPGIGNGNQRHYSGLENSMDRSQVRCSPWDHKELKMTEQLSM